MTRFLSIRWKIIFLASVVLAAMAVLFAWQQQIGLREQFARERLAFGQHLQITAERLFALQNERLQVITRGLAETPPLLDAWRAGDQGRLAAIMAPIWSELSLGQGLQGMAVFDASGRPLGAWGEQDLSRLAALAQVAVSREQPQVWVSCGVLGCVHQLVLPIGSRGKTLGSVAISAGLENLVLDMRRLANGEVALLIPQAELPQNAGPDERPLAGMRVLSSSGSNEVQTALREAIHNVWPEPFYQAEREGKTWSVLHLRPQLPGDGLLQLAVLSDVSEVLARQRQVLSRNLLWGGVVLLASIALLYVLLRAPMNRISEVARLLPLLGRERFQDVRDAIEIMPRSFFNDEISALTRLAGELARQLQQLNEADEAHATKLSEQAAQLEHERDFITGLLDTAPVLIVTYGVDGRIRLANAYAAVDIGLSRESLIGQVFGERFMNASQREEHAHLLMNMAPGDMRHNDGSFMRGNERREVVWFHSCMEMSPAERTYLSVGLEVTAHRLAEQRLQLLVERDAVTGLLNRRTFKRELETMLASQARGMLLVCDLDEFRSLNDAEGHEAGDRILILFAQHIQHLQPAPVLTARLGSDEFAMVFLELNQADGILLARHLSRVAAHHAPAQESELSESAWTRRHLSASVGLVAFPEHGEKTDLLLGNAELALTHARAKGHGSWHLYSAEESYRENAGRRAYWRDEVEAALDEDRFVLHYQPIIEVVSGELSHYEALLRMVGRDGKLVPPGLFIDTAESTGLIRRIDRWVLAAAVRAASTRRDVKIAFNLSSRSFDDDVAFETMRDELQRHHVAGARLKIEITETAALANFSGAKRIMDKFQGLGCVFGLDDFGVGYSSFQYLKELPVGFVKIDGSFIKSLTKNPDDMVFVRALNSAVQGFGKTTVAEFVEDEATLAILREIGVDHAQGYLIGKPEAEMLPPLNGAV